MRKKNSNQKKKANVPLFWKFTIGMVVVVVLFGSINVGLVHRIIFSSLEEELEQRGVFMSQIISQRAINYILFDDIVSLNILLADESIIYIMVCEPDCEILAHTFETGYPEELNKVHDRKDRDLVLTEYVQFEGSDRVIRDISVPLMEGRIGFLRVGLTEDHIANALSTATGTLFGMIFILILISIIGTFLFSYLVTSPVKDISSIAEALDMQSIKDRRLMLVSRYPKKIAKILRHLPGDEIDILVSKFNEMVYRLQEAYTELEAVQHNIIQSEKLAAIGTLASGVAHEVNNPLAGIMNCITRIKKNPENYDEIKKYLGLMEEASKKMEAVIKNLLNFARQSDEKREDVYLQPIINNAVALSMHKPGDNELVVTLDEYTQKAVLLANKNQLEQVFLNIILNSMDALSEKKENAPDFKGYIKINGVYNKKLQKIIVEISDNGTGIAKENLNKIIDPFFTTKAVGKGTGLGLAVSMNIIREHGGSMEISSEYKHGTTVRISLPEKLN